jgi:hypothetical protein
MLRQPLDLVVALLDRRVAAGANHSSWNMSLVDNRVVDMRHRERLQADCAKVISAGEQSLHFLGVEPQVPGKRLAFDLKPHLVEATVLVSLCGGHPCHVQHDTRF